MAYRSPYLNEPGLPINTRSLHERHLTARSEIKRDNEAGHYKRRVESIPRPDGNPLTYTYNVYRLW